MDNSLTASAAKAIRSAFELYQKEFRTTTRRARRLWENRDYHALLADSASRLDIYSRIVLVVVAEVRNLLRERVTDKALWQSMKQLYSDQIAGRDDLELAETFFNSVTRRIFITVGVDPSIEYVDSDFEALPFKDDNSILNIYVSSRSVSDILRSVLEDSRFRVPFARLDQDISQAARRVDGHLQSTWGSADFDSIDFLKTPFFRGRGAYLVGRIIRRGQVSPLVLSLRNLEQGIVIDAVLLCEDDVSILFSFTRSYFLVEADRPHQLVAYIKTMLPLKRVAELYISIGYNKHGKTELYRDLLRHMESSNDIFQPAEGQRGMVMIVFTLPSYDMVFKVIRDRFPDPKRTSREGVRSRYQLVFKHDRAGRLVDAQEFEHLSFEKDRFSPALLEELLKEAPSTVSIADSCVDIQHVYLERRMTPLDIYIRQADEVAAREAVIDYGNAIKDLAATDIFPGDILLKNFGVTRHGRVVFYDYDELCLLEECSFRSLPSSRSYEDDFESEPWFYVNPSDIFPSEFSTFLGLTGSLREAFEREHADLFGVEFWKSMQAKHALGEVVDIYPYKQDRRLLEESLAREPNPRC